jgi:hypothetical protein
LVADFPGVAQHRFELATNLNDLAALFYEQGRLADAEKMLCEARDVADTRRKLEEFRTLVREMECSARVNEQTKPVSLPIFMPHF